MELAVYDIQGKETGRKVTLNDSVFAVEPNEHVVWLDVKQFLANQRQGTHKSKERSEVSGSTRKLHKQKGGAGSRIGDINSPVLVGGGRVFGPRPRDYRFKLNKKMKQLARRSAWSVKAAQNELTVIDSINFEAPRTKDFVAFAKAVKADGKKLLLVVGQDNRNVYLSARNIPNTEVMRAADVNTYALLNASAVVMTEEALNVINNL